MCNLCHEIFIFTCTAWEYDYFFLNKTIILCIVLPQMNCLLQYFLIGILIAIYIIIENEWFTRQFEIKLENKIILTLVISVPLTHVDISENRNITVQETYDVNVSCTARSRPLPYFTWFISGRQVHENYTTITYNDIIVTSTVSYRGNRSDNNNRLYCRVDNGFTELSSAVIFLNITCKIYLLLYT